MKAKKEAKDLTDEELVKELLGMFSVSHPWRKDQIKELIKRYLTTRCFVDYELFNDKKVKRLDKLLKVVNES